MAANGEMGHCVLSAVTQSFAGDPGSIKIFQMIQTGMDITRSFR